MKIVFVGGSNNNNFAIVRYLRARGVDAHLRLFKSDPPHFHPACDTFSTGFMDYTETLDWSRNWVLAQSSRSCRYTRIWLSSILSLDAGGSPHLPPPPGAQSTFWSLTAPTSLNPAPIAFP